MKWYIGFIKVIQFGQMKKCLTSTYSGYCQTLLIKHCSYKFAFLNNCSQEALNPTSSKEKSLTEYQMVY